MCHGPFSLMNPVNPVLPGEGRWPTGDASAPASKETGLQLDPEARLVSMNLLKRLESEEVPGQDSSNNCKFLSL